MNEAKHTPGPWAQDDSLPHEVWAPSRRKRPVCSVEADGSAALELDSVDWANARLISAAPDLLEALEEIVAQAEPRNAETVEIPQLTLEAVRAAIAKAKS